MSASRLKSVTFPGSTPTVTIGVAVNSGVPAASRMLARSGSVRGHQEPLALGQRGMNRGRGRGGAGRHAHRALEAGEVRFAHAPDERVAVREVGQAARVLALLALRVCGTR